MEQKQTGHIKNAKKFKDIEKERLMERMKIKIHFELKETQRASKRQKLWILDNQDKKQKKKKQKKMQKIRCASETGNIGRESNS